MKKACKYELPPGQSGFGDGSVMSDTQRTDEEQLTADAPLIIWTTGSQYIRKDEYDRVLRERDQYKLAAQKRLLSAAKVQPERRPYNASGSLSEYGVFPECDAQQPVAEPHPGTGVKCAHCNGSGKEAQVYDEQTGWSDEKACDTCNGSGRITTVEQYLKTLPANWHEDSGLETWFPITAEEIERLRARIAELEGLLHDLLMTPCTAALRRRQEITGR